MPRRTRPSASRSVSLAELVATIEAPALAVSAAAREVAQKSLPAHFSTRSWTRVFGIDKTLAWKLTRLVGATDLAGVLGSLPGRGGVERIAIQLRSRGCPPELVGPFEKKAIGLWTRLDAIGVDRRTLASLAAGALDSAAVVAARGRDRAAMRIAMTRMFGVSAAFRMSSHLVAPSLEPGMVALGHATLIDGFVVHETGPPWCLLGPAFQFAAPPGDLESTGPGHETIASSPESGGGLVPRDPLEPLVAELSDPIAVHAAMRFPGSGTRHVYLDRSKVPLGRPMRIAFGEWAPKVGSAHAGVPGELGMIHSGLATPVGRVIVEILMHRDLPAPATPPTAIGFLASDPSGRRPFEPPLRIPLDAEVMPVKVDAAPRGVRSAAERLRLLELTAKVLRTRLDDYDCHRLVIKDPPYGMVASIRWRLPEPPPAV